MEQNSGIITSHYIFHWGVPSDIHPLRLAQIPKFAIFGFSPTSTRQSWRYATNGMSSYVQSERSREIHVKSEIFVRSRNKLNWIYGLLSAVATYPLDYNTSIVENDTIDVGQPIDRDESKLTGLLITAPGPDECESLGVIAHNNENILVHEIIAVYPSELEFAKSHGGAALAKLIVSYGDCLIDGNRPSVV